MFISLPSLFGYADGMADLATHREIELPAGDHQGTVDSGAQGQRRGSMFSRLREQRGVAAGLSPSCLSVIPQSQSTHPPQEG